MGVTELVLIAISMAADAFAVSVCKGLACGRVRVKRMLLCGAWFGGFQALMPLLGYLLGGAFKDIIASFDYWVAFFLLSVIGISMIWEAFKKEDEKPNASFAVRTMLVMAIATSIDALAVGVAFGVSGLTWGYLALALGLIGGITFILSCFGVKIGAVFGSRYRFVAQLCGGIMLVLLGVKMLLEGLGVLQLPF